MAQQGYSLSAYERMDAALCAMDDAFLTSVWKALDAPYALEGFYDEQAGVTMTDWAELVYSEISNRGLSAIGENAN